MATNRRYDIDWIRVIAIGLLLIYHIAIGFQSWGIMIGFITNEKPWTSLWIPMAMLNVWRIPLLFFVSGMGIYFAMQSKNWRQLLTDRLMRIFLPFIFGMFVIVPVHMYIFRDYYNFTQVYDLNNPGHLWFLGNIFVYVLLFSPLFIYLKNHQEGVLTQSIKKVFGNAAGLIIVIITFVLEVVVFKPNPYELYAMTWHGFFLGLFAFFFGFCFVLSGEPFLKLINKWRWIFLIIAFTNYVIRVAGIKLWGAEYLIPVESNLWIFSVLAFGNRYLNHSGKALSYLSQAAYPVYIIHMIFLYAASWLIFPMEIDVHVKFILVLTFTVGGCLGFYELFIRRWKYVRVLFGLKSEQRV
ncbi:MAG: acyltransferase [Cyclobacteriaceae bacterium]|nr:acyltransferase [Cyclobacteriaceae bacterium]